MLSFAFIRFSTRMIRAQVSWWPGNIDTGGVHVHHMVFGIVLLLLCGFLNFALDPKAPWVEVLAAGFGIGAGLTLDEFALWLHLEDVYWADEGRQSIEATAIAVAIAAMVLLGVAPFDLQNQEGDVAVFAGIVIGNLLLVAVVLLKGKLTTAVLAAFVPLLALVGAMRLARPGSPWAKRRYEESPKKLAKATERDRKWERRRLRLMDLVGGAPVRTRPGAVKARFVGRLSAPRGEAVPRGRLHDSPGRRPGRRQPAGGARSGGERAAARGAPRRTLVAAPGRRGDSAPQARAAGPACAWSTSPTTTWRCWRRRSPPSKSGWRPSRQATRRRSTTTSRCAPR